MPTKAQLASTGRKVRVGRSDRTVWRTRAPPLRLYTWSGTARKYVPLSAAQKAQIGAPVAARRAPRRMPHRIARPLTVGGFGPSLRPAFPFERST